MQTTLKKVFLLALLLGISQWTQANQVCWCSFEVFSQNQHYLASIEPAGKAESGMSWKTDWRIKVYELTGNGKKLLWESRYDHPGKTTGKLSEDGQYFTYVEDWYYTEIPLLKIYKQGKRVNSHLDGNSFSMKRGKLKKTPLHYLWLSGEGMPYQYRTTPDHKTVLVIKTIDKREFTIDLDEGTFQNKS